MSAQTRVVFLSSAMDISGGEIVLIRLLENNHGLDATLISPNPALIERLRPWLTDAVLLPSFLPLKRRQPLRALKRLLINYPLSIWAIARAARRQKRQIIMAGAFSSAIIAWLASRLSGTKAGWFHQHPVLQEGGMDSRIAQFLMARGLYSVPCSEAMARPLSGKKDFAGRFVVIPNSVDSETFDPAKVSRTAGDKLLTHVPATAHRIALVAMITEWKGHHLLVEAAALLKSRGFDASKLALLLIGGVYEDRPEDQAYLQRVKEEARHHGISEQCFWLGKQRDVASLLMSTDVLVNCSTDPEPFGLTVIEAMALKRLVLVPDIGGPSEVVMDGVTGFQFHSNDAASLADRLEWILTHLNELDAVRDAARALTLSRFQNSQVQERYADVFHRMLAE